MHFNFFNGVYMIATFSLIDSRLSSFKNKTSNMANLLSRSPPKWAMRLDKVVKNTYTVLGHWKLNTCLYWVWKQLFMEKILNLGYKNWKPVLFFFYKDEPVHKNQKLHWWWGPILSATSRQERNPVTALSVMLAISVTNERKTTCSLRGVDLARQVGNWQRRQKFSRDIW